MTIQQPAGDKPAAPFAVLIGLQGGYLPNNVMHCADIEQAREVLVSEIEHATNFLAEDISTMPMTEDMSEDIKRMGALTVAVTQIRSMPASELAQGFSIETATHSALWLVALDPADYDPESCN